jgi:hypothetical protein
LIAKTRTLTPICGGGQSSALRRDESLGQVIDGAGQLGGEIGDRLCDAAQHRIADLSDGNDGHRGQRRRGRRAMVRLRSADSGPAPQAGNRTRSGGTSVCRTGGLADAIT